MGSGAHVTAAGVWTDVSEISKKYDISDLPYDLVEIMKMEPAMYKYKVDNSPSIGFITQEMEQIIPEVVSGEEGEKEIAYGLLASVLVNGIQELGDRNDLLESRVGGQQATIDVQQREIDALRAELTEIKEMLTASAENQ